MNLKQANKLLDEYEERINGLLAENKELKLKVRQLEVANTNLRLADKEAWCSLKDENDRLKEEIKCMGEYE